MTDRIEVFKDVRRGMIPAHIYNDAELFELEKQRLFSRAWLFVAHESEIPQDGDYVVRRVLNDSFIIARDSNGEIRALFNMCLHRGMQICRAEIGNASNFRCPYHGWSYRNDGRITGLPFHKEAYGGEDGFKKRGQTLLPAPNLASYNGLIFISMDPEAQPLEDFLGDFTFYLDYYTKQSTHGLEVSGPQRWRIKANWKIGAENFAGDMYHTPQTHTSVVEIGLFREPKAQKRKEGATYWADRGGGTTYKLPPGTFEQRMRYVGYPDDMIGRIKEVWTTQQQQLVGEDGFMISAASCFPNMSFVHNWPKVEDGDDVLPFISIRTWQPISENETEVYSWFAVDAAASQEYKQKSYKAYLMCFGSTGMFEQDDVENWVSLTNTAAGSMARRLLLNSRMGLLSDDSAVVEALPADQFHGPGYARVGYNEHNQRELLKLWADYLEMPVPVAATTTMGTSNDGITPLRQTNGARPMSSRVDEKGATQR